MNLASCFYIPYKALNIYHGPTFSSILKAHCFFVKFKMGRGLTVQQIGLVVVKRGICVIPEWEGSD